MCLLPLIAWLTKDWFLLGVITTVPFFLLILCWWFLPESPRWLLSRGHIEQCAALMTTIATRNGKQVPDRLKERLQAVSFTHNTERNYGVVQLLNYSTVRLRTLLLTACYACNYLFYYGLAYNTVNLSGNEFLNFFLLSVVELPSTMLGWWAAQFLGRRWTGALSILLAAIFSLANAILLNTSQWVTIMMMVLSKMFNTISFLMVYIQCSEIYPTTHRSCGTGLSSLISSIFGTATPYIAYSHVYWNNLPLVIIFVIGFIGFINASLLPETLDADLPQSLLQADKFLTGDKYWSYKGRRCWSGKVRVMESNEQGHTNLAISED
nr:carcinine transporter-like [Cherax quadricarinatus]